MTRVSNADWVCDTKRRTLCRVFFSTLLLFVLFAFLPVCVSAEDRVYGAFENGIEWHLTDSGELILSGAGKIPDFENETELPWYFSRDLVREVTVNEGITEIGSYAFASLPISQVSLPATLTVIGSSAFRDCTELYTVQIPRGVAYIRSEAFGGCTLLHKMLLPSTLTDIGEGAFSGCDSIAEIYYEGDSDAFEAIRVGDANDAFLSADVSFHAPLYKNVFGQVAFVAVLAIVALLAVLLYRRWNRGYALEKKVFGRRASGNP